MFINQTMYAVVNNEDNTESAYEFVDQARNQLVRLAEKGIDAHMFVAKTVRGRQH